MKLYINICLIFVTLVVCIPTSLSQDTTKRNRTILQLAQDSSDIHSELDSLMLDSLINQLGLERKEGTANSRDSLYFKIIKSFDIFGAFFRELIVNYVVELDPEEILRDAINGITWNLDPYTNFFLTEADLDEVINYNTYTGLGIVVGIDDSLLMVIDFTDSLAKDSSGLKIGDKILRIDSIPIPPNLDTLKKFTTGKPNTNITLTILREGRKDTLEITIARRQIQLPDVSFSNVYESDSLKVLYIKLDRFSNETPFQIRNIVSNFLKLKSQKSIIMDVRNNPGGTLESAVSICEMFLPLGATIVSIEGKNKYHNKVYKSITNPLDTTIPIVVLVNSSSASASEVLAGAFQDNDRAIIIGQPTFGKGLIQSVVDLPYESYLKITTAKYFTPSGRSLHRLRYPSRTNNKLVDNRDKKNSYHTLHNREVVESSGIQPDITIDKKDENPFIYRLKEKYVILKYVSSLENTGRLEKITSDVGYKEKLIEDFINYLEAIKFQYKSELNIIIDSAISCAKKNALPLSKIKSLEKIKNLFKEDLKELCLANKSELLNEIETEIQKRRLPFIEFQSRLVENDPFFRESVKILKSPADYSKKLNKKY
jgi:carboxyl-terminal processing protease